MPHTSTVKFNARKGMLSFNKLYDPISDKILTVTSVQSCVGKKFENHNREPRITMGLVCLG